MDTERRALVIDGLEVETRDGKPPMVRGHAAVFDRLSEDLGGFRELVARGAFAEAIKSDDVRALFNHDKNYVLGRNRSNTLRLSEDASGLAFEIDMPDNQTVRDLVLAPVARGDITGGSFGFVARKGGQDWVNRDGGVIRTLKDVRLFDISLVTFPAYPAASDVALRELRAWSETQLPPTPPTPFNLLRALADQAAL